MPLQAELAKVHGLQRVQRLASYAKIFVSRAGSLQSGLAALDAHTFNNLTSVAPTQMLPSTRRPLRSLARCWQRPSACAPFRCTARCPTRGGSPAGPRCPSCGT